ncbi:MAG: cation:proton antiporter [Oscillospiraceae bacterium]
MDLFLAAAIALIAGLLMTRVANRVQLPDVTAYLVTGVLVGPFVLGRLGISGLGFTSLEEVERLGFISTTALGFIAFTIGNEFKLSDLKKTGTRILIIGILEGVVTSIVVDIVLLIAHSFLPGTLSAAGAITMGAIAAATAPAATLMVVRQYKAKGAVTDVLLPVVALDDAVGLAVFAVSFGIARAMSDGMVDMVSIAVEPLVSIVLSLVLGGVLGEVLTRLEAMFHSNRNRMALIVGFVLLTVALAMLEFDIGPVHISFSSLLVCMALGVIFCNRCPLADEMMDKADKWTSPLFAMFFILSGAELDLSVFKTAAVVGIGLLYIIFRCVGKFAGAYLGTTITGCEKNVRKWLGVTLFPQAGVALGMSVTVSGWGAEGALIRNIILFGVLVYELFGPVLTKFALTRSGDIQPKSPEIEKRRENYLAAREK